MMDICFVIIWPEVGYLFHNFKMLKGLATLSCKKDGDPFIVQSGFTFKPGINTCHNP
jgi:hypothetical protein